MKLKTFFWSFLTVLALSTAAVGCDDDDPEPAPTPTPDPGPEGKTPVLVLNSSALEVAAEGGEQALTFKIENAVENQKAAATSDAKWFSLNAETNGAEGRIVLQVSKNEGEAREAEVTVTYKGAKDAKFMVKQAAAEAPAPSGEAPKLEMALNYDKAKKVLCMDLVCTTKNAEAGLLGFFPAYVLDQVLQEQGMTIEEFMETPESGAQTMPAELLAKMNGDGFKNEPVIEWTPDMDGMLVAGIVLASNANGKTVARAEATLGARGEDPTPTPGDGPQITYTGRAENGMLYFTAISASKNVASGEVFVNPKADFDSFLGEVGGDFNKLVDGLEGMGQAMPKEWCDYINSDEGLDLQLENPDPTVAYGSLIVVYDAENHRSHAYAEIDAQGAPKPVTGKLRVEFMVMGEPDAFILNAVCLTKNAAKAYVVWTDPAEVDKAVAQGATLETMMDEAKSQAKAQEFTREWINSMNDTGIGLTLGADPGMKMAFLLDVSNDDSRVVKRADAETPVPYEGPSYVQHINDAQFREKVWDYKTDAGQFVFKGTKPCVLDFGAPAWCGWCIKLQPVMNQASATYKDKVDFYEIDTDKDTEAVAQMSTLLNAGAGVPLLITVDAQGKCKIIGGYVPYSQMCAEVDALLGTTKAVKMVKLTNAGNMKGMTFKAGKRVMISVKDFAPRSMELKNLSNFGR